MDKLTMVWCVVALVLVAAGGCYCDDAADDDTTYVDSADDDDSAQAPIVCPENPPCATVYTVTMSPTYCAAAWPGCDDADPATYTWIAVGVTVPTDAWVWRRYTAVDVPLAVYRAPGCADVAWHDGDPCAAPDALVLDGLLYLLAVNDGDVVAVVRW